MLQLTSLNSLRKAGSLSEWFAMYCTTGFLVAVYVFSFTDESYSGFILIPRFPCKGNQKTLTSVSRLRMPLTVL